MPHFRVNPSAALLACLLLCACAGVQPAGPAAETPAEDSPYAQKIVDRAAEAVARLSAEDKDGMLPEFLAKAKGALVFPGVFKASFFWGVQGGMGVLLARNATGEWSAPAFYSLGGGSIGLQIGLKETAMLFVFVDQDVFRETIRSGLTFDTGVSFAVMNVGGSRQSGSLGEQRDIYCFTEAVGLYVGTSLTGGFLESADSLNRAYYGRPDVTPRDILLDRRVDREGASALKRALDAAAVPKKKEEHKEDRPADEASKKAGQTPAP